MEEAEVECRMYKLEPLGYHASIVVYNWEYSYGDDGLTLSEPSEDECENFSLGKTTVKEEELEKYVSAMKNIFCRDNYNLLECNCITFASELCKFLGVMDMLAELVEMNKELAKNPFVKFCSNAIYKTFNYTSKNSSFRSGSFKK